MVVAHTGHEGPLLIAGRCGSRYYLSCGPDRAVHSRGAGTPRELILLPVCDSVRSRFVLEEPDDATGDVATSSKPHAVLRHDLESGEQLYVHCTGQTKSSGKALRGASAPTGIFEIFSRSVLQYRTPRFSCQ